MVVLTLVAQTNGQTFYFDEPIPKVHFMKLLSCSLYNSWHNLTSAGQIYFSKDREVLAYTSGPLHFSVPRRRADKKFRTIQKREKNRTRNKQTQFCSKNNSLRTNHRQRNLG